MDTTIFNLPPDLLAIALCFAIVAGVIKGMVGFAMPMILISGLSTIIPPELALAGLIMPTLVTNLMQAFRQGLGAVIEAMHKFRVFLIAGGLTLILSAQLVRFVSADVMLLIIGVPVAVFAFVQLIGVKVHLAEQSPRIEAGIGAFAGSIGGISGVWGPPTVMYLTALDTEKTEQMRVQGVIYGLGAVLLVGAHIGSGVLRADTIPFSLALVPPAVMGMWLGSKIQDRIDQRTFRKATLFVLTIAALNLIRRALFG